VSSPRYAPAFEVFFRYAQAVGQQLSEAFEGERFSDPKVVRGLAEFLHLIARIEAKAAAQPLVDSESD